MTIAGFNPERSIATLTVGELEQFIQTTIQKYTQHLIPPTSELDTPFDPTVPSFGTIVAEQSTNISDDIWQTIPEDASKNIDTYCCVRIVHFFLGC